MFTKYDQFLLNVEMHLQDYYPTEYCTDDNVSKEAEKRFQERYLQPLGDGVRYVRLQSGFRVKCQERSMLMFFGRNAYGKCSLR